MCTGWRLVFGTALAKHYGQKMGIKLAMNAVNEEAELKEI